MYYRAPERPGERPRAGETSAAAAPAEVRACRDHLSSMWKPSATRSTPRAPADRIGPPGDGTVRRARREGPHPGKGGTGRSPDPRREDPLRTCGPGKLSARLAHPDRRHTGLGLDGAVPGSRRPRAALRSELPRLRRGPGGHSGARDGDVGPGRAGTRHGAAAPLSARSRRESAAIRRPVPGQPAPSPGSSSGSPRENARPPAPRPRATPLPSGINRP